MIPSTKPIISDITEDNPSQALLLAGAISRLLLPLARLCLAHGVAFAAVEEMLKQAFVQEAGALQPGAPTHGTVSRISTATGLTRREVTRLINREVSPPSSKPPIATEVFARWKTDPNYQDSKGTPSDLKRLGPAPSFEALAQSITRDVHPRSMLDELIRLGLVRIDEELDMVSLTSCEFVPRPDAAQMLGFLGDNVGDHLDAAVTNVLQDGGRHLEQAVFADELSSESLEAVRTLFSAQWTNLRDTMVPAISHLIESDRLAGRRQDKRIRIGLYTFDGSMTANTDSSNNHVRRTRRRNSAKGPKNE